MAAVNDVPHLVDKKGGSYAAIAPKLEAGKFNKYKKYLWEDFQENSYDEVDERSSEEYLRDLDIEYHKRALLANSKHFIKRRNNFSDYKAEYKKMKAKLALLEASPSSSQNPKTFQPKKKADNELTVGKSHTRNGEWVDITIRKVNTLISMDEDADWQNYLKYINIDLKFVEEQRLNLLSKYNKMVFELNECRDELLILKQAKLDAVTFQIQNTKLTKLNHALQEQLKEEKKINEKWLTSSKKVSQCIRSKSLTKRKKILRGELLTQSLSKMNINENAFIPASMDYDYEMVPKSKDWIERLNPDSKLLNFNTGRILVPESQVVNESLKPTEASTNPESSNDYEAEPITPLPLLNILQGASLSLEDSSNKSVSGTVIVSKTKQTTSLIPTEVKDTEQE
ncbi:hypothetical protein Tco_1248531 [Tanacetum coccineum]